jgi:hypothetical protein
MVFRRAFISVVLWAAVSVVSRVVAEENVPAKQSEGPLGVAKRDYAAIQASGNETPQLNGFKAPRTAPPLELPSDGPPALSPMQRARLVERKKLETGANRSKTWLIDALRDHENSDLEKPSTPYAAENEATRRDGLRNSARSEQEHNALSRLRTGSKSKNIEPSEERPSSVPRNPLDTYMAQWMTGRDLEIFKASRHDSSSPVESFVSVAAQSPTNEGVISFPTPDMSARHVLIDGDPISLAGSPSTNPYLELMRPPLPRPEQTIGSGAALNAVLPSLVPSTQQQPARHEQPEIPASKSLSAELLKAQDDARYFKQLKRF